MILARGGDARYTEPAHFVKVLTNLAREATRWCLGESAGIDRDPRYIAFQTIHDWIVLNAKIMAERVSEPVCIDPHRLDPFTQDLSTDAANELRWWSPRLLLHGNLSMEWSFDHFEPDWRSVKYPFWTLHFFFHDGIRLEERLRVGRFRDRIDPRLSQVELLGPDVFRDYVSSGLGKGVSHTLIRRWKSRPLEDVECDPRYAAHRCALDRQLSMHACDRAGEEGR